MPWPLAVSQPNDLFHEAEDVLRQCAANRDSTDAVYQRTRGDYISEALSRFGAEEAGNICRGLPEHLADARRFWKIS